MSLKKAVKRTKSINVNFTDLEYQKLETLAKNKNMVKSVLARELIKIAYEEVAKKEL